jgi:hypothetical protein
MGDRFRVQLLKHWNATAGCSFSLAMVRIFFLGWPREVGYGEPLLRGGQIFSFSVETGKPELRLEERRKGFARVVSLGSRCIAWLIVTVKEVLWSNGIEEFAGTTREASNVIIVKRGATRPVVFWKWRLKLWDAREGLFCCQKVVKGGDGVDSLGS